MEILHKNIKFLKGIGEKKAILFKKLGIFIVNDLLHYYPRDYIKWGTPIQLAKAVDAENISAVVTFTSVSQIKYPKRNLCIVSQNISDESGNAKCIWFNQKWLHNKYSLDEQYFIHGKVVKSGRTIQIHNPAVEKYDAEIHSKIRLKPIYNLTSGLPNWQINKLLDEILRHVEGHLEDDFSNEIRDRFSLPEYNFTIQNIHRPISQLALVSARRRLVFEELFNLRIALRLIRDQYRDKSEGAAIKTEGDEINEFTQSLPYQLTNAQQRVSAQVLNDMAKGIGMNRMIQGDVGSGKTVVAAMALYIAAKRGYQGIIMAPTGILAAQHYKNFKEMLEPFSIKIGMLTGSMRAKEKRHMLELIKNGEIDIVVGTHALLETNVSFSKLGLAVTDEQHRFGVRQRGVLSNKGHYPHILVMSATPIPRTLSLVLYGDLDISVIDEMPVGRKAIKTYCVSQAYRQRVYRFIRKEAESGGQVYAVCPLIEDSDILDAQSAQSLFDNLKDNELKGLKIALLHGRMKKDEKAEVMEDFANGKIMVLVSTTVIEVGVDVKNANLMVIENAERFGLAQLHQLRGRVGRGSKEASCILLTGTSGQNVKERMKILTQTNDGFKIAEKDMELRGTGDYLGTRQHGLPEFQIASLPRDLDVLKEVDIAVKWFLDNIKKGNNEKLAEQIYKNFTDKLKNTVMN